MGYRLVAALAIVAMVLVALAVYVVHQFSLWIENRCGPDCTTFDELVEATLYIMMLVIIAALAVYGPAAVTASRPFIW